MPRGRRCRTDGAARSRNHRAGSRTASSAGAIQSTTSRVIQPAAPAASRSARTPASYDTIPTSHAASARAADDGSGCDTSPPTPSAPSASSSSHTVGLPSVPGGAPIQSRWTLISSIDTGRDRTSTSSSCMTRWRRRETSRSRGTGFLSRGAGLPATSPRSRPSSRTPRPWRRARVDRPRTPPPDAPEPGACRHDGRE